MTLEERATKLQGLLAQDGIDATYQECVDLLVADLVQQISERKLTGTLDTVSA